MKTTVLVMLAFGLYPHLPTLTEWLATSLPAAGSGPAASPTVEAPPDHARVEPITVVVASGRSFTGKLDPRTDATELWLRWEHGSAVLGRPIRWDRVVRVRLAGEELSGRQLLDMVRSIRQGGRGGQSPFSSAMSLSETGPSSTKKGTVPSLTARGGGGGQSPFSSAMLLSETGASSTQKGTVPSLTAHAVALSASEVRESGLVRGLAIDAAVANWDADVEVDGLQVCVYPLDVDGQVAAASGRLDVELYGQWNDAVPKPQSFVHLGRWVRQVAAEDCGTAGAVYRLPFQGIHPEFDLGIAARGTVHARLSVPGQGTFETTDSTLRIRPYSAVRDQLQQATGRRFFQGERTGEGR